MARRISRRLACGGGALAALGPLCANAASPGGGSREASARTVNVLDLGADPTGRLSAASAFNQAIAGANARATADAGVDILVPDGTYAIDTPLDPVTAPNVVFRGSRGAVLKISAAGSVFTWSGNVSGGGVDGMTVTYPSNPASTAILVTVSGAFDLEFRDLRVKNLNTLCVLGTDARHIASNIRFENITGDVFNSGQPTFDLRWGSDLNLAAIGLFVAGVPVPAMDRVSTMATAPGTDFIRCVHGGWDTLFVTGGSACNRYWRGVHVNAPGAVIQNLWLDDCIFDYCSSDAISLNAPTHATGGVFLVSCRNSYLVSWSGAGIRLTGDNPNELHDFSGAIIYMAGAHGIHLSGRNTRNIRMNGLRISNPNRLGGGDHAGIRVDPIRGGWEVIGGNCLSDPSAALGWSAAYGVDIAAGNDGYVVQGADYAGALANYRVAPDGLRSGERLVSGNLRADYAGFHATGLYRKPASGADWVNTTPFLVTVTAAGMDLGLGMDGVSFAPLTSGAWDVPPGHSLSVRYSGAGAIMRFFVKP